MSTNTGGPAFPSHGSMGEVTHEGMTLRDYFAAKAMHALITGRTWDHLKDCKPETLMETWAIGAFATADAMLRARGESA